MNAESEPSLWPFALLLIPFVAIYAKYIFDRRTTKRPPLYVDQQIIERYGDYKVIGQWGCMKRNESGEFEVIEGVGGQMLSETVKYLDDDGKIKLGSDWVADNDKSVTGFDPPSQA